MFEAKEHAEKTLHWWNENRFKINMSPTYQRRGSLWSEEKKAKLIDSVLNDYDIPKIYLADFTSVNTPLNEARTPYAVIDGKQRLETFFQFFDNELRLADEFVYLREPSLPLSGLLYEDLKFKFPKIAQKFEKYIPAIISVVSDEEERIDEMFVRLNSGLMVNAAERRNAMPGPVPRLIRKMVLHKFFADKIAFDTKRMNEFNAAAKILLIEYRNKFVDTKAGNLDRFVLDHKETNMRVFSNARQKIEQVLDDMTAIFKDRDSLLGTAGPIPLYYWFVRNNKSDKPKIRLFLEKFNKDVRTNFELSKQSPRAADPELINYYTMGRTTNDQGSLSGRYEILQKRFRGYLRQAKQKQN
jgi:hypothetical protein